MNNVTDRNLASLTQIENSASEGKIEFQSKLVLVVSTLFGILISLQPKTQDSQLAGLLFLFAILLLGVGLVGLVISLRSLYKLKNELARQARKEISDAIKGGYTPYMNFHARQHRYYVWSEHASYICFLLAVVTLVAYSITIQIN